MEEEFVSFDIQVAILDYLTPKDVYSFGLTSNRGLQIMDCVFKKRSLDLIKERGSEDQLTDLKEEEVNFFNVGSSRSRKIAVYQGKRRTWMYTFVNISQNILNLEINLLLDSLNEGLSARYKSQTFQDLMDHLLLNQWLILTKKYSEFLKAVEVKLLSMKEYQYVDDYYKKLFPSTYLEHFSYNLDTLFGKNDL